MNAMAASTPASALAWLVPSRPAALPQALPVPGGGGSFSEALGDARAQEPLESAQAEAAARPQARPPSPQTQRPAERSTQGSADGDSADAAAASDGVDARDRIHGTLPRGAPRRHAGGPAQRSPIKPASSLQPPPAGTEGTADPGRPLADTQPVDPTRQTRPARGALPDDGADARPSALEIHALVLDKLPAAAAIAAHPAGGEPDPAMAEARPFDLLPGSPGQTSEPPLPTGFLTGLQGQPGVAAGTVPASAPAPAPAAIAAPPAAGTTPASHGLGEPPAQGLQAALSLDGKPSGGEPASARFASWLTRVSGAQADAQGPAGVDRTAAAPGPAAVGPGDGASGLAAEASTALLAARPAEPPAPLSMPLHAPAGAPAAPAGPATSAGPAAREIHIAAAFGSETFTQQVGQQISLLAIDGVQHARLHLHPAEMGPITVQIAVDNGQAQVTLVASQADTRELLEQAMPELASSLRESGLTLSGGGVFEQPRPRGGRADVDSRPAGTLQDSDGDTAPAAGTLPARSRALRGVVDLYA